MKTTKVLLVALIFSVALMTGCTPKNQSIYYWGDYYQTYYDATKKPCKETQALHQKTLDSIIEKSEKQKKTVPPGIYAEYGYYMLQSGKTEKAITYFNQEKTLYPESDVLMDRLIASALAQKEQEKEASPQAVDEQDATPKQEQTSDLNHTENNPTAVN